MAGYLIILTHRLWRIALWALAAFLVASVAHGAEVTEQTGIASWYGGHGLTAYGARYREDSLTAASRTWQRGTLLRVTNLANGNSVIVRIEDRGPYVQRRILDLSLGAARRLGMVRDGLTMVRVQPSSNHAPP